MSENKYNVQVSETAAKMLVDHSAFLATVNEEAATGLRTHLKPPPIPCRKTPKGARGLNATRCRQKNTGFYCLKKGIC